MSHVEGIDRDQMTLFPEALDDYVSQENPVRFLDAFVGSLDLEGLDFAHAVPNELGRPPYNPADLLRLYTYGYLNRIRSSRQLEREANRNVELMWLLRRLAPDFPMVPGPSARPSPTFARTMPRPSAASAGSSSPSAGSFASSEVSSLPSTVPSSRRSMPATATSPPASSRTRPTRSKPRSRSTWTTWRRTTRKKPTFQPSPPKSSRRRSRSSGSARRSCAIWARR